MIKKFMHSRWSDLWIEAIQFDGSLLCAREIIKWTDKAYGSGQLVDGEKYFHLINDNIILSTGNWLVKDNLGLFALSDKEFNIRYTYYGYICSENNNEELIKKEHFKQYDGSVESIDIIKSYYKDYFSCTDRYGDLIFSKKVRIKRSFIMNQGDWISIHPSHIENTYVILKDEEFQKKFMDEFISENSYLPVWHKELKIGDRFIGICTRTKQKVEFAVVGYNREEANMVLAILSPTFPVHWEVTSGPIEIKGMKVDIYPYIQLSFITKELEIVKYL